MSAFLPRLRRWTLLDSCWSLFGPCVWFSQSSETGQRVFLEKELTCPVSLPEALAGALPRLCLNWSGKYLSPFHDEENVDLWVFPFPPLSDLLSIYGVGRTAVVRHP